MFEYPRSAHRYGDSTVSMVRGEDADFLKVAGPNPGFSGTCPAGEGYFPLDHANTALLRRLFPFCAPKPVLTNVRTVGVGDRLGIATPGHLRVFEKYDAVPVLAQQSIRELTLTNRTFGDVLDCATRAVFREDFQRGYGADGDHLKTDAEVEYALGEGYTMLTLDCSEHIRSDVLSMTDGQVAAEYRADAGLESIYLGKTFSVEGQDVTFGADEFKRTCLIYCKAIDHAVAIYRKHVEGRPVDFEVSIDETMTPTTPVQHYFVANELTRRGVKIATVAPRFCGEFQKGIDYIGDASAFDAEMDVHAAIARHFGHKVSVHSGSDKFSIFPSVGARTHQRYHVKTAGTNWLEAMKLVAEHAPELYREVHAYALTAFDEATKYYHVTTNLANIPSLDTLSDAQLPALFENNDARQLIHITYGLILNHGDFHARLYAFWRAHADEYAAALEKHIGRHLETLGCPKR